MQDRRHVRNLAQALGNREVERLSQRHRHGRSAGETSLGLFRQGPQDDIGQCRGHRRVHEGRRSRWGLQVLYHNGDRPTTPERQDSGTKFIEHHAKRVDIALYSRRVPPNLFW